MTETWHGDPQGGFSGHVRSYGHWGRPVLAFPAEGGSSADWESNGMVDAVSGLLDAGRIKLYCVDSADGQTWSDRSLPHEERARRHEVYERWILDAVVPFIAGESDGRTDLLATGVSLGAFHAANIALRHADRFPTAVCMSGNYDPSLWHMWGERGDSAYFNNPVEFVPNLDGDHLNWLRGQLHLTLVVGQGAFEEHPTHALSGSRRLSEILGHKGIPHDLDVWGDDVPHDWESWRRQAAHHLPRFC
jgi:esterase/lipase superfamily enzyme